MAHSWRGEGIDVSGRGCAAGAREGSRRWRARGCGGGGRGGGLVALFLVGLDVVTLELVDGVALLQRGHLGLGEAPSRQGLAHGLSVVVRSVQAGAAPAIHVHVEDAVLPSRVPGFLVRVLGERARPAPGQPHLGTPDPPTSPSSATRATRLSSTCGPFSSSSPDVYLTHRRKGAQTVAHSARAGL